MKKKQPVFLVHSFMCTYMYLICHRHFLQHWLLDLNGEPNKPLRISSSGWAPCWLRAVKAVCSCLRSYKRVVEFFHCGANGGGLTGGEGLRAHECVFVCVYLSSCTSLCKHTSVLVCSLSLGAYLTLYSQHRANCSNRVHMRAVCKDAMCVIFSLI